MKLFGKQIDEPNSYRVPFFVAVSIIFVLGVLGVYNSALVDNIRASLDVGQYYDNAEFVKYNNDTICLYGSENREEYDYSANKEDALDCLQYSRDIHSYYMLNADPSFDKKFELTYGWEDLAAIIDYCSTEEGRDGDSKFLEIGTLGEIAVTCKENEKVGKFVDFSKSAKIEIMKSDRR